jgi:hypothetical protein
MDLISLNFGLVFIKHSIHESVDILVLEPKVFLIKNLVKAYHDQYFRQHAIEGIEEKEELISCYSSWTLKTKNINYRLQESLV